MSTLKKATPGWQVSLLLALVVLMSLLPLPVSSAAAEEENSGSVSLQAAQTYPTEVGNMKAGQEFSYFTEQDGALKQTTVAASALAGSTIAVKWANFKQSLPVGLVRDDGVILGIACYDAASGTLYIEGQVGCSEYVGTVTEHCPDVLNVVVTGNTSMTKGWYGKSNEGLARLNIILRNNAKLTIQHNPSPFVSNAALAVAQKSDPGSKEASFWWELSMKYQGTLEVRGTGTLEVVVPDNSVHTYYGLYAKTISILENASLSVDMGQKYVSEEWQAPAAIRCDALNIDTTGSVDISISTKSGLPGVGNPYFYCYSPLYTKRTPENYGFNVINAAQVTLKGLKGWLFNKTWLAEEYKDTDIYEYICDAIRAKEGWKVKETLAGTDTPYTLQFVSPSYSPAPEDPHPTKVAFLANEMGYYINGRAWPVDIPAGTIIGSTPDSKWKNFLNAYSYSKYSAIGWVYYDQESGTVYIKGEVDNISFVPTTDDQDTLRVIVDGDANVEDQIESYQNLNAKGIKKMTMEFRNNGTLTLTGKASGNGEAKKRAILDITWDEDNNVRSYGDLELRGKGALKVTAPDDTVNAYGIRAGKLSILGDASLDVKLGTRNKFSATGKDWMSAIACKELEVNTTGAVTVDVSEKIDSSGSDGKGFFNAIMMIENPVSGFHFTKAKKFVIATQTSDLSLVNKYGGHDPSWLSTIRNDLESRNLVMTEATSDEPRYVLTITDPNNRPAPDVVKSYTANAGLDETALRQGQAKFTWVEIYSDRDGHPTDETYNEMTATMRCEIVDANIAQRIGYNSGDPSVTDESLLYELKNKLKGSKMYHDPSERTLDLATTGNMMHPYKLGKGTFRYLLSVEAYFNDTYYFDGAGITFEEGYSGKMTALGTTNNYVAAMPTGVIIFPDTDTGVGDPPTRLKLVIDNRIGREFTNTNIAPQRNYYLEDYPDKYVANFRWINMPNTDLDIELKANSILHVGKYFSNMRKSSAGANITADDLTISGNGVLLASTLTNAFNSEKRTAGYAIRANTVTVDSGDVILDLKRDDSCSCINVPTPSAFRPLNARYIQLAAKDGRWIVGLLNNETHMQQYYGTYWDTFTIEKYQRYYPELDMVTFGHTRATLSDPVFTLGGTTYQKGASVPDYVLGSGSDTFSISFTLGPKWARRLCALSQVKSNAAIEIWRDGVYLGKFSVAEQYNYSNEDVAEFILRAENFTLEAGHVYRIYGYMCPYNGGVNLAEGKGTSWTFYVCGENDTNTISQVALQQKDGDISASQYTNPPGNRNTISVASNSKYTLKSQSLWYGTFNGGWAISGNEYTKTVTLQAQGSYRFTQYCDVTVNATSTEVFRTEVSADRKTLDIYLQATCVQLLREASGTLMNFYQGMDVGDAYVVSDHPDQYDIEIVYVGERSGSTLSEPTFFDKDTPYAFGLKVVPKAGYGFLDNAYGTVELKVQMDKWYHGDEIWTVETSYETYRQVGGTTSYSGRFYETVAETDCWAPPQTFDRIDITLSSPVAGKSAAECPETLIIEQKGFSVVDVEWSQKGSGKIFTGTFQAGETYSCDFWVEYPWYMEPSRNYTVYVNGEEAWNQYIDDVIVPGKEIIAVNQRMTAVGDGVMLSGLVTSFGSSSEDVTIQLIADGNSEAAYETIVQGNSAVYSFSDVLSGDYTMRVMKKNHVTREYAVSIGALNVRQDAKIHLKGDINGDGKVNTSDVGRANAHVKKVSILTGYEYACADVNGDGKVNTSDVGRLNAHVKKTSLLW